MRRFMMCVMIYAMAFWFCSCSQPETEQSQASEDERIDEIAEQGKAQVCATLEEAEAIAGFGMDIPEHPGGFDYPEITAVEGQMISICFYDMRDTDSPKARWYQYEKASEADGLMEKDVSYPDSSTETIAGIEYACKGEGGFLYVVDWEKNGYAYRMSTNAGCLAAELPELLEGMG